MKKKVKSISFLGTGNYSPTHYVLEGAEGQVLTSSLPLALVRFFNVDEVVILATEKAEMTNGEILRKEFKHFKIKPCIKRIPSGNSVAELWDLFTQLHQEFPEGKDVTTIFDITHGFRSMPFFSSAAIAYTRSIQKDPGNLRVVYGAYDARDEAKNVTPIWDLTPFIELLDWTNSIMLFLKTGKVADMASLTEASGVESNKHWYDSGKKGDPPKIRKLGNALSQFGQDLATLRTGSLFLGEGKRREGSAAWLVKCIEEAREQVKKKLPPLNEVLDKISHLAQQLETSTLQGPEGHRALSSLAKIYLEMERYPEAAATVREGEVTLLGNKNAATPGKPGFDKEARKMAERIWKCGHMGLSETAEVRNDIEHAGYSLNPLPADSMKEKIAGIVETFGNRVEPALEEETFFINLSNHPCSKWRTDQLMAATKLAKHVIDIEIPEIEPVDGTKEIENICRKLINALPAGSTHAMVMSEFTLTMSLVKELQRKGIKCLASTSERKVSYDDNGDKTSYFDFVKFREYPDLT